ncbi:hypothetical protein [Nocardia cyriacigeorgica]|uniref:hypothetical protein n=1 Tax=Nocardia cyriacigeorgica TaxID=135487 RepID=UPI002454ABF1|nr:hypothetical protein [Nocardia cyriacigeorgica]
MSLVSGSMVAAIEDAWAGLRARHPDVPDVVITIASGSVGRRGVRLGQFGPDRWVHGDARLPELFIGGEGFAQGPREVMATLLHEAAHGIARTRGVKDTSRNGAYHNGRYRDIAAELGLGVERHKGSGWSITNLPDAAAQTYQQQIAKLGSLLVAHRRTEREFLDEETATGDPEADTEAGAPNSKPSRPHNGHSLTCSCEPVRRVRASQKTVDAGPILCGVCQQPFAVADGSDS